MPTRVSRAFAKTTYVCASALLLVGGRGLAQQDAPAGGGAERRLTVQKPYLHLPVSPGAGSQVLSLSVDGKKVRGFDLELATGKPDFWVYTDVGEWMGKTLTISSSSSDTSGIAAIIQADKKAGEEDGYNEKFRPQFHFSPLRGWLGDANGLVYYKGEWHLFYQHNPFGTAWGNMTWGHAVSPDLVHWQQLDDAIHPDELGVIFTGSAVADTANTSGFKTGEESPLVAMYTYMGQGFSQGISYSLDKGRHWTKYANNPVMLSEGDSRDPKVVWHAPTHQWLMIMWLRENIYGLFTSPDLKQWTPLQELVLGWEMPDIFEIPLDGDPKKTKWVITGPQDWYAVGSFDGKKFTVEQDSVQGDEGPNYGAVQTYNNVPASDGRVIQQGWLRGTWPEETFDLPGMPFNQQMAFPRELTLRTTPQGLRLFGVPAREISTLHETENHWTNVVLKSAADNPARDVRAELSHVKAVFTVDTTKRDKLAKTFGISMRGFSVLYDTDKKVLRITPAGSDSREVPVPAFNGPMTWEILQDRTSVEVFVNNGIVRMAYGYIPKDDDHAMQMVANGGEVMLERLDVFGLKSAWKK